MSEHTAGELRADGTLIRDTRGTLLATAEYCDVDVSTARANAARLALCWNSLDDLVAVCQWIGNIVSTASDGGRAWGALREQPGAREWGALLKTVIAAAEPQPEEKT